MLTNREKQAILSMVHKNRHGDSVISLENSRLDFSSEYLFRGFTANGIALAEAMGGGPEGIRWKNRMGKVETRKIEDYDAVRRQVCVVGEQVIVSVDNYAFSLRIPLNSTNGSGWHKHPELHSEAARRGWEERRQRLGW